MQVANLDVLVVRKPIKNLHLSVLPPIGKVRVSVPLKTKDDTIQMFLATKLSWIKKQRMKFMAQKRQTRREYIAGESHYFMGKRYRLEVIYTNKHSSVCLKGKNKIVLHTQPNSSREYREKVITEWYRDELKKQIPDLIKKYQKRVRVKVNSWGVRKMKTRWGTCNVKTKRVWFNLELVKKPSHCLDFIIVHELTHLLEKNHNDKYKKYMNRFMPNWRQYKEELNSLILPYASWSY